MKIFDYSELLRVINNVNVREEHEKLMMLINLKEKYRELRNSIIESGVLDDWYRFKQLCQKTNIRLSVSHLGKDSMGIVTGLGDYSYCQHFRDNGTFSKCMSSGSSWADYFGFNYTPEKGINWNLTHNTKFHSFEWFKTEKEEYETKINLLEIFRDTYEDYRNFQLKNIEDKFKTRIKPEDIIKTKEN